MCSGYGHWRMHIGNLIDIYCDKFKREHNIDKKSFHYSIPHINNVYYYDEYMDAIIEGKGHVRALEYAHKQAKDDTEQNTKRNAK
jgi:hypothetical protein